MNIRTLLFTLLIVLTAFQSQAQDHSVARDWNEVLLTAIRNDLARPTVHARNLWHTSMAMYDAWAVYDDIAEPYLLNNTVGTYTNNFAGIAMPTDIEAARNEAISFAMYRILRHRFQNSPGAFVVNNLTTNMMNQLGYNANFTSLDYSSGSAAALGNYIGQEIINLGLQDGANEQAGYGNTSYTPVNPPLVMAFSGNSTIEDPNRWQPLTLNVFIDQSGNVIPFNTPPFLSPEWGQVTPFALSGDDLTVYNRNGFDYNVYHDPGLPPYLNTTNPKDMSEDYKWGFSLVSIWSSLLDPTDGVMIDISPASIGNIESYPTDVADYPSFYNQTEGGDSGTGRDLNPVTGQAYEPQMVPRADYARVLAEFWADGPESETPPGHWFTLLNYVSDHPMTEKRFGGEREILDDLQWDVKSYFLMGSAMHDVAVCTWGIKGWYDYIRPVSAIRAMAELGQSSDASHPSYHIGGLPLVPGYIEIVEPGDPLEGSVGQDVGKVKVYAWRGPDYINNPATDVAGVDWILAEDWWPYQRPSFVTPNFAGYLSGHSTFSSAAADVMTALTGDAFFPGGMGEFDVEQNDFLVFEQGPSTSFTLQWATYRDASDQTSLSRIYGGIHPPADDIPGRLIGRTIANNVFTKAQDYFFRDADDDGFYYYEDCNDNDASINPNATEICDGMDNNCSGFVDDGLPVFSYYRDLDNDGFGDAGVSMDTCLTPAPMGFVLDNTDCNDTNPAANPNMVEVIYNGEDDDCNPATLDDDLDQDGFMLVDDCDDGNATINPNASEIIYNGIDDDCNPATLDDDLDQDGFVLVDDCDDNNAAANPDASEITYNGIDDDCNPATLDDDLDQDGFMLVDDCNDNNVDINPDASEIIYNGIDDDCNPATLDDDLDQDGFMLANDCDDNNADMNPMATDIPDNNIDEDCSGYDLFEQTKLFPNPTFDGKFTVHYNFSGDVLVQIFSIDGKLLRDEVIVFENNFITYDLGTDLASAVYVIRFFDMSDETYFVEKIRLIRR